MAQKLFIKTTGEDGKSGLKAVHVVRSWQESSGAQIYLHANGTYGYKDASPVRKVKEFDIIGDPIQRKIALAWWERTGKALSEKYYKEQEEKLMKQQGDIQVIEGDVSDLDVVQYIRRLTSDRRRNAWSDLHTWLGWFSARPDWWGHAGLIEIAGYRYKMIDQKEVEVLPEEDELEQTSDQDTVESATDGEEIEVPSEKEEIEVLDTKDAKKVVGSNKKGPMVPAGEIEEDKPF